MRRYVAFLVVLQLGANAAAQQSVPTGLTVQNELRLRYEQKENADFSSTSAFDPQDALGRLRIGLRWRDIGGTTVFFQPQYSFQETRRAGAFSGTDHDPHVHQLFADVDTNGLKWRLGRQELIYGDERLVGAANWLNKGRSFDGARLMLADARTKTDIFGATLGQFDFKTNEPTLAGIYSTITRSKAASYDLYLLYKDVGLSPTSHQSIYTVGTRPVVKLGNGFDAKVEAAYQFGTNAGRSVSAYAYAAVLGYTPKTSCGLRVFVERDFASGGNPGGAGAYHTFDQLFPTNHGHYGLADYVGWRNMQSWRVGAQAKPTSRLSLSADGHFFRLADAQDFWYGEFGRPATGVAGAPLRDPTGASGKDLGTEFDFTATYAVGKGLSVSGGYARFMPGSFVKKTNGGRGDASDWFYLQGHYSF